MTIKISLFPDGKDIDWQTDSSRLAINTSVAEILPVGIHKIAPPQMKEYHYEVEVFKNGEGIVRNPEKKIAHPLINEGDIFILSNREKHHLDGHIYGVVFYEKGKSPER